MSGIAGIVGKADERGTRRMVAAIAHRGPDHTAFFSTDEAAFGECRLNRTRPHWSHPLPLEKQHGRYRIVWDGALFSQPENGAPAVSSEAVADAFSQTGASAFRAWDGMFAFALYDTATGDLLLGRDRLGIKPLYYGYRSDGALCFASEMKGLLEATDDVRVFPPGHVYHSRRGWYEFQGTARSRQLRDNPQAVVPELRHALDAAVAKHVQEDDVGTFLSGGLDSSLIASLARRHKRTLPSFAVGVTGCTDLVAAREVADVLGTRHYQYEITRSEVIKALPDVIRTLESFDPALVRGAIATHFAARLASEHASVVLSGEGADELFGGYDYLKELSPNGELNRELLRITNALHVTGLQRVDRLTSRYGLEARLPFLDDAVVDLALSLSPRLKAPDSAQVEKWIVRRAGHRDLPATILWRAKEKFAIGTGTADILRDWASNQVSDTEFRRHRFLPGNFHVKSKEELYYYKIFREFFDADAAISAIGRSRSLDPNQRYA